MSKQYSSTIFRLPPSESSEELMDLPFSILVNCIVLISEHFPDSGPNEMKLIRVQCSACSDVTSVRIGTRNQGGWSHHNIWLEGSNRHVHKWSQYPNSGTRVLQGNLRRGACKQERGQGQGRGVSQDGWSHNLKQKIMQPPLRETFP